MSYIVRLSTIMAFVVLAVGVCMFVALNFEHVNLRRGFDNPVLAMELARSTDEVKAIIDGPEHSNRSQMRSQQRMDFVFIFAYGAEFVLMSILLWQRRFRLAKVLAVFSGFFAVMAAGLDVRENLLILEVISEPVSQLDAGQVQMIRFTAIIKWSLLYAAILLLSFVLIGRNHERASQNRTERCIFWISFLTGLLFFSAALSGQIGIGSEYLLFSLAPSCLKWSTWLLTFGLVGLALTLLVQNPSMFLRRL